MNKKRILKNVVSRHLPDGKGGTDNSTTNTSGASSSSSGANNGSSAVQDYIDSVINYNSVPSSSTSSTTPTVPISTYSIPTDTTPTTPTPQTDLSTSQYGYNPNGMTTEIYNSLASGNLAYNPDTMQQNDPLGQLKSAQQLQQHAQQSNGQKNNSLPQSSITPNIAKIRNWRNIIPNKSKRLSMA